nr:hypothetical protein [Providencia alcalifaciens]
MTPKEKLKEIDKKLDEAHALVISLQNMRREHINRHDLNKEKSWRSKEKEQSMLLTL